MRLLNTETLGFEEFYDRQVPAYAILSHRWGSVDQEVSYQEYLAGQKRDTAGFDKIMRFCRLANESGLKYGWIDTCCIDKSSSAELSETINSMFQYYADANVCYAYLPDVVSPDHIAASAWFTRGWTLQELIAPSEVLLLDREWGQLGSRYTLRDTIAEPSGVDKDFLVGKKALSSFSVAQKMSWASHRKTSRIEDEAYCLLGLFGINMPLLYGERTNAFRRLQEAILTGGDDNSLFAWGLSEDSKDCAMKPCPSLLAPSPYGFRHSRNVQRGFATQRISFELTNRGMMVLIHQSYNPKVLKKLLRSAQENLDSEEDPILGLTLPLGCFIPPHDRRPIMCLSCYGIGACECVPRASYILRLILDHGRWRRVGVSSHVDEHSWADYSGKHYFAYTNDYVRIYVHHDKKALVEDKQLVSDPRTGTVDPATTWLHIKDKTEYWFGMQPEMQWH